MEGDESFEFLDLETQDPIEDVPPENRPPIRIAIVGRPTEVGKSTLMNALLEEDRVITGPEAGLTRDLIAVDWEWAGRNSGLVDTGVCAKKGALPTGLGGNGGG